MWGVKGKFVLVAAVIVTISSVVWGCWLQRIAGHLLFENLENKARLIVTSFKDPIINSLLDVELEIIGIHSNLDNIIEEIINNNECEVLYADITDLYGKVVATDNMAEYGKIHVDPLGMEALKLGRLQQRIIGSRWDETGLLDLAMPLNVHGKKWGVLRVHFSLRPLHEQLNHQRAAIFTLTVIICLVEMAIFYVVGLHLTRPLQDLAGAMAAVDPVILASPLTVNRNDEIGVLQKSFRQMLDRLKRSESERQRAVNSLVQTEKLAIIGKLATGVAHEVNNPLAAITNCIFNLKQVASKQTEFEIEIMGQACSQIQNIVNQLLDFTRAGQLSLEPVQSDEFFVKMTLLAEMTLKKKGVVFKAHDRCHPPLQLTIDKSKFTQVALNILMNAAEASPPGDIVEMSAYSEDETYCLAFRDHGTGIPLELQEKIFELFYTLKSSRKGNGIGLAISRNIVDMHCGTIMLDSKPGETVFTVIIPLVEEQRHDSI